MVSSLAAHPNLGYSIRFASIHVNHWGFAGGSEQPWPTEFVVGFSPEAERRVGDLAGEAIDENRVAVRVHRVLHLGDQAGEAHVGEPALEHRELHALAVFLANFGQASQPRRTFPLGVRNVVGDENVHRCSRQHERSVVRQVAAQVSG